MRRVLLVVAVCSWTAGCGDDVGETMPDAAIGGDAARGDAGPSADAGPACHDDPLGLDLTDPDAPIATLRLGRAVGVREESPFSTTAGRIPVFAFKGLRYGEDTGGASRWRPPVPADCYDDIYDATSFRSQCLQSARVDRGSCPPPGSEDCLFLNVFVPDPSVVPPPASGRYPVMVWIHGGNFEWGASSLDAYQPHSLATWGVIVVSINYRVGTMGFLAHPGFADDDPEGATGNYGIQDQTEALRWVQRNIDGFGGDPNAVTIFGQSAGGSSTCYHVASPRSAGLFHRAILQSDGGCFTIADGRRTEHAEAIVDRVERIDGVDCRSAGDVASCLRGASPCALAAIDTGSYRADGGEIPGTYAGVDGYVLTEPPLETFVHGRHNHVPVMVGATNREERWVARSVVAPEPTTEAEYRAWFEMTVPEYSEAALRAYPLASYATPMDGIELFFSDNKYECRQRRVRRALVGSQTEPVFSYVFAHGLGERTSAAHGEELAYLFANPAAFDTTFDASDWAEVVTIQAYWTQFAKTGDPNGGDLPRWDPWDEERRPRIVLDNDPSACTGLDEASCGAGCTWVPTLGCGSLAFPFEGDYRDAQCDGFWEPLVPYCGDGRLQVGESCDDGNAIDGDGCDAACTCSSTPMAGDGVCDPCENAVNSPADCGGNCYDNGNACPGPSTCDPTGTCR